MLILNYNSICLSKYIGAGKEWNVYYMLKWTQNSKLRLARILRQQFADEVGISLEPCVRLKQVQMEQS